MLLKPANLLRLGRQTSCHSRAFSQARIQVSSQRTAPSVSKMLSFEATWSFPYLRVALTVRNLPWVRPQSNQRTPLYDLHLKYNGRMVEFAGFDMPLNYQGEPTNQIAGGPVAEHHQVRKSAGLFDVSHMVQTIYTGPGALKFLSHLLPSSLSSLPVPENERSKGMKSSLSVLLNEQGGIIDDCMVTRWGENSFYIVTNAGRAERDMAWIKSNLERWNEDNADKVEMKILTGAGLIALQGPKAYTALQRLVPKDFDLQKELHFASSAFVPIRSLSCEPLHVTRAGYTGEDGFEISIPSGTKDSTELSEMLLEQEEVKLAGLACRDSLRLEAGLCLYGHDLDEGVGIGEAGLGWVVGRDRREDKAFIGSERTLAELKKGGTTRKRIGLVVEKGPPAREGSKIFSTDGETQIGTVTSGLPSPTIGKNISMGYIDTKDGLNKKGSQVLVQVRNKMRKAEVCSMPWIEPGYYRG